MTRDKDLSILGSLYVYYVDTPKDYRHFINQPTYETYTKGKRALSWQNLTEKCAKTSPDNEYPVEYIYERYYNYMQAKYHLEVAIDDESRQIDESLEISAKDSSELVSKISFLISHTKKSNQHDIITAILRSINSDTESSMAQMVKHLSMHMRSDSNLAEDMLALGLDKNSVDIRDSILFSFLYDSNSIFAHETKEINRERIKNIVKASYNRGFVFGSIFALYRFSQRLHDKLRSNDENIALGVRKLLSLGPNDIEIDKSNNVDRKGSSHARLLHERNKLMEFIIQLRDNNVIDDADYERLISTVGQETEKLHAHFVKKLKTRFRITAKDVRYLQSSADKMPVYGYVSSGAAIKKIKPLGDLVYCVLTNDNKGNLCLTTAYDEDMFIKAGGIIAEEMTDKQRELYTARE